MFSNFKQNKRILGLRLKEIITFDFLFHFFTAEFDNHSVYDTTTGESVINLSVDLAFIHSCFRCFE